MAGEFSLEAMRQAEDQTMPLPWTGLVRHNGFRSPQLEGLWMKMMKKLSLCLCLLLATLAAGQVKKAPVASGAVSMAAKTCDKPYAGGEVADGWPEGRVTILFHREKSKAPWAHNPAIRVPGLEATAPASARTVVCVDESRVEMGHYDSGEPGYAPSWGTILVRLADR